MKRVMKTLIAGTAIATLTASLAYAQAQNNTQSQGGSQVLNGQIDMHVANSTVNADVNGIAGNVSSTSVAGGNALDVTTMDDTNVTNSQYVTSIDISADQNANVKNVNGTVALQSQAVCNSASISTDPTVTSIYSSQECDAVDPSSSLSANLANIGNDVSLASTAIGNSYESDTNASTMPVQNYQLNQSSVYSNVNANVANVAGNLSISSAAVGNTAQIIHY